MNNIRNYIVKAIIAIRSKLGRDNADLPYYLLIFFSFIVFVVGVNIFVELTDILTSAQLKDFDRRVTDYVTSFRTPERTKFFQFITDIGDLYGYVGATVLVAIFFFAKFRNWRIILELLVVTILAALSNVILKRVIDRARPTAEHLVVVETLSYPSGHAMSAMAFYGFLIYLVFRIKIATPFRVLLMVLFAFLILSIGVSRIYLGVHFPSDVLGGFIAGLIWITFCIVLFNIIDLLRRRKSKHLQDSSEENLET